MNIIICGVGGRIGRELVTLSNNGYHGIKAVAGVDVVPIKDTDFPCYTSWNDVKETADCIIDFSNHAGTAALIDFATKKSIPLLIATTGHTEQEVTLITQASTKIPVFYSANMSLGIALLIELAKITAKAMPEANIEIIEKHHNRKLDAPSGTALMIANAIKEVRNKVSFVLGRSGHGKRTDDEIGIHAIRMGNIVGEHEVIIGTDTQTITLKHECHTRALLAEGAMNAAEFLAGKSCGLYSMQDMIDTVL